MKIRYNFPLHQQDSFTTYTHARSAICLKHRTTLTKHTPLRDADMRHSLHNNGRGSSASLGCNLPTTLENSHPPLCLHLHTQHPISYITPCSHFTILRTILSVLLLVEKRDYLLADEGQKRYYLLIKRDYLLTDEGQKRYYLRVKICNT